MINNAPSPEVDRPTVAMIGTYPPTRCGIATFNAALRTAMMSTGLCSTAVVEVTDRPRPSRDEVVHQVVVGDASSLSTAAGLLTSFDAVIVQHEFGIFGGRDGSDVLILLAQVTAPIIVVVHTVPVSPTDSQRAVIERLATIAAVVITMSETARKRLLKVFTIDADKVLLIPHGAHPNACISGNRRSGRPTILTWGLLGPGKGIEAGIDAVAMLADLVPTPRYVIAGATHPKVIEASGETYRQSLIDRIRALGIESLVEFDEEYRDIPSLNELVRSADVVLLPYESQEQVTSGVLIDAVASGRPVVATAFPHATELLADGAGIVVEHGDVVTMSSALRTILTDPRVAGTMRRAALDAAEPMLWPTVGATYARLVMLLSMDEGMRVA
jgi:polysaccharide biosynthesis protein PslF